MRMTKVLVLGLLLTAVAAEVGSQVPIPRDRHPLDDVPIATIMRRTVAFIRVVYREASETKELRATGFFVFVEEPRVGEGKGFTYLVTNRHVASPKPKNPGTTTEIVQAYVRLNLKQRTQGQASKELNLLNEWRGNWFFPSDDSVDLAVMPINLETNIFEVMPISSTLFVTPDSSHWRRVVEGAEISFAGFFYQFPGREKIQPIVREGILALVPDEKVMTTQGKPGTLYLADLHVFSGNSGAPVFISLVGLRGSGVRIGGPFPYGLLGVVSGYFFEDADFKLQIATTIEGSVRANSGISAVVPAEELKRLLDSPTLVRLRDAAVERARQTHP